MLPPDKEGDAAEHLALVHIRARVEHAADPLGKSLVERHGASVPSLS
jgi:hypothetical protein